MQFHNKFEYFCPKCSFLSFYYLILTPSRFYCWSWRLEIKLGRQIWQELNAFSLTKARPAVTHNYIWTLECGEVRTRCSSLPCAPTLFSIFSSSFSRLCEVEVSLTSKIMPQRMILTASNQNLDFSRHIWPWEDIYLPVLTLVDSCSFHFGHLSLSLKIWGWEEADSLLKGLRTHILENLRSSKAFLQIYLPLAYKIIRHLLLDMLKTCRCTIIIQPNDCLVNLSSLKKKRYLGNICYQITFFPLFFPHTIIIQPNDCLVNLRSLKKKKILG